MASQNWPSPRVQTRSAALLRRHAGPYEVDVLGISLEKGGTSVLADRYLVAGSLTEAQGACFFVQCATTEVKRFRTAACHPGFGLSGTFAQGTPRRPWPRQQADGSRHEMAASLYCRRRAERRRLFICPTSGII